MSNMSNQPAYQQILADHPLKLFDLHGRVALVTGGSRGLGAIMAGTLAHVGASVVITGREASRTAQRAQQLADITGNPVQGFAADSADEQAVQSAVDFTAHQFGGLDILINNAGINVRGPIQDITRQDFDLSLAVNITGPWMMCRAALPLLSQSEHARVINIASTFGVVASPDRTPYTTSKGAIVQLTRALALEWAPKRIAVNAIAPGPFLTEMNLPFRDTEHTKKVIEQGVALQRWGELHEIQGVVLLLASDASSYITGAVFAVDGGWTAH